MDVGEEDRDNDESGLVDLVFASDGLSDDDQNDCEVQVEDEALVPVEYTFGIFKG